jgi:hypothetical protein
VNKLHEREMLNLVLPGGVVERFAVTRKSWRAFLQKLFERDFPELCHEAEPQQETSAIPSQL